MLRDVHLVIVYACVVCRKLFEGESYSLRRMFGVPAVCPECLRADKTLFH